MGWVAREKQVTEGSSLGLLLFSGEAHARGWLPWRDRWERVGGWGERRDGSRVCWGPRMECAGVQRLTTSVGRGMVRWGLRESVRVR